MAKEYNQNKDKEKEITEEFNDIGTIKIHARDVDRDTSTKKVTQTENSLGYYIQGDDNINRK